MPTFRKRPVQVEAIQWNGEVEPDHPQWLRTALTDNGLEAAPNSAWIGPHARYKNRLYIRTLEGVMMAVPGDWVIRGVKGELYPCKPDIFEATYEKVE